MKEQRKYPRLLVRALVDYESTDTYLYDYSSDLSEGGIFIETEKPLPEKSPLTLRFTLPNIDRVFEVKGLVAWHNQPNADHSSPALKLPRGMGVEFIEMNDTDLDIIRDYLKNIRGKK